MVSKLLRKAFVVCSSIAFLLAFQNWITPIEPSPEMSELRQPASVNEFTQKIADLKSENPY